MATHLDSVSISLWTWLGEGKCDYMGCSEGASEQCTSIHSGTKHMLKREEVKVTADTKGPRS